MEDTSSSSWLDNILNTGLSVATSQLAPAKPGLTKTTTASPSASTMMKWAPWAIGAVGVIVLIVVVLNFRGRGGR
jgi:bacteriorhodopsin